MRFCLTQNNDCNNYCSFYICKVWILFLAFRAKAASSTLVGTINNF